jgi:hypothetical protein
MSNLDRILELAKHGTTNAQSQVSAERELKEEPSVPLKKYRNSGDIAGKHDMKVPDGSYNDNNVSSPLQDRRRDASKDRLKHFAKPSKSAYPNSGDIAGKHDMKVPKHDGSRDDTYISSPLQNRRRDASKDRTNEAVGEFAEPIYDLIDMHFEGDCQPVFDDLVRYLSGDQIKDFVEDFRRHHELPMGDDMDEAQQLNASDYHCSDCGDTMHKPTTDCGHDSHDETGSWWKDEDGNGVPDSLEEAPNEGNEFSGELAKAKASGKKEFEVDGKKYKVEESEPMGDYTEKEFACINIDTGEYGYCDKDELNNYTHMMPASEFTYFDDTSGIDFSDFDDEMADQEGWTKIAPMESDTNRLKELSGIREAQSQAQKDAFAKMLASKKGAKKDTSAHEEEHVKKEELEESPTMDTTQLITLLKNSGLSEEAIEKKINEWANTPEGAAEDEATSHGEPYENFAQSVNLSLKRYLDAEDFKVGLKEHKVEDIKEAYKKSKGE